MSSTYAHNYRLIRTVVPLLILVIAALLFWSPSPDPETLQTRSVTGQVVEVNTGEGEVLRSGQTVRMTTARVRLPNGDETRVLVQRQPLAVGDTVELIEARDAEGRVRYRLP
ncbi:hypothetical protein LH51_17430 [Nitrincola sp. A-D6]|nr:hypothetical protein LH51_17430 [Nitrincola sp. A-D6]